jgi:hypothetical protein
MERLIYFEIIIIIIIIIIIRDVVVSKNFWGKLCNDKLNVQVFSFILFIYLLLPYMFRAFS